ncbi:hypothetical protein VTN02DRAFT_6199 [Thermoascus thermophilus]
MRAFRAPPRKRANSRSTRAGGIMDDDMILILMKLEKPLEKPLVVQGGPRSRSAPPLSDVRSSLLPRVRLRPPPTPDDALSALSISISIDLHLSISISPSLSSPSSAPLAWPAVPLPVPPGPARLIELFALRRRRVDRRLSSPSRPSPLRRRLPSKPPFVSVLIVHCPLPLGSSQRRSRGMHPRRPSAAPARSRPTSDEHDV